jgi:hypothetical protein
MVEDEFPRVLYTTAILVVTWSIDRFQSVKDDLEAFCGGESVN